MINTEFRRNPSKLESQISATIDERMLMHSIQDDIYRNISRLIAERYVKEHYQDIVKNIDQQAIATLSVAESSAKIRETLEKKLPDKILEIVKKEPVFIKTGSFGS